MKINDHGAPGAPNRAGKAPGVRTDVKRARGETQPPRAGEDRVSVSEEARTLSRLRAELDTVADIRTQKVEELRGQIERGEYRVDVRAVARKLLQTIFGERFG